MPTATQVINQAHHKMLLWGTPKGGGKSTFAMYAPKPIALLMYDLGNPVIPPGVNGDDIYVKMYPPTNPGMSATSDKWTRPRNVGEEIIQDLMEMRRGILDAAGTKLAPPDPDARITIDGEQWPIPRTLVLDGGVALNNNLIDWILAVNNIKEPDEYQRGTRPSTQQFWGKRLDIVNKAYNSVIPLPVNIIIITWQTAVVDKEGHPTNKLKPNLGGQLDIWGPGKVDTSIYCSSRPIKNPDDVHYFLRTKPNALIEEMGVRNLYGLPAEIDVTVTPTLFRPTPWERLWGKEANGK